MPAHDTDARSSDSPCAGGVMDHNIAALVEVRERAEREKGVQEHVADAVTAFSGSMVFVYLHLVWFCAWVLWNAGWGEREPFDPYPFGMLTTIVSLEAIFLSTFVLITQNRQAKVDDRREDLDLQINLLAEHEITRLLRLTDAIARHLGIDAGDAAEMPELTRDVRPDEILEQLDVAEQAGAASPHKPR